MLPQKYLQALKRIVGKGLKTSIHGVNQIPGFKTILVKIRNLSICNYEALEWLQHQTESDFQLPWLVHCHIGAKQLWVENHKADFFQGNLHLVSLCRNH
jgi:hypothetical protein